MSPKKKPDTRRLPHPQERDVSKTPETPGIHEAWALPYLHTGIPQTLVELAGDASELRTDGLTNIEHAAGVREDLFRLTGLVPSHTKILGVMHHDQILQRKGRLSKQEEIELSMKRELEPVTQSEEVNTSSLVPQESKIPYSLRHNQVYLSVYMNALEELIGSGSLATDSGKHYLDQGNMSQVKELLYAFGIAVSAQMWEIAGKGWRDQLRIFLRNEPGAENLGFLDEQLEAISKKHGISSEQLGDELFNALQHGGAPVPPYLREFRAPVVDLRDILLGHGENFDIEGLLIKATEINFNLKPEHRNREREASSFRDAQELVSLYAPILEFLGFDRLAAECYATANEYFYQDSEHMENARDLRSKAESVWLGDNTRARVLSNLTENTGLFVEQDRIKLTGNILEKLEHERGTPDLIGLRLEIPEFQGNSEEDRLKHSAKHVKQVINTMEAQGFELADPRGRRPIEMRLNIRKTDAEEEEGVFKENFIDTLTGKRGKRPLAYTLRGPSVDGYEGIHIVMRHKNNPEVTLELQLFTPHQREIRDGIAKHAFYKAKDAVGELGEARRLYNKNADSISVRKEYFHRRAELLEISRRVNARSSYLLAKAGGSEQGVDRVVEWLNPGTMDYLLHLMPGVFQQIADDSLYDLLEQLSPAYLDPDILYRGDVWEP